MTKANPEKADAKVTMANVKVMKLDQKSDTPMPTIVFLHRRDSLKTQGQSRITKKKTYRLRLPKRDRVHIRQSKTGGGGVAKS